MDTGNPEIMVSGIGEQMDIGVPDQMDRGIPEQMDTEIPGQMDTGIPEQIDAGIPAQLETEIPEQIDRGILGQMDTGPRVEPRGELVETLQPLAVKVRFSYWGCTQNYLFIGINVQNLGIQFWDGTEI